MVWHPTTSEGQGRGARRLRLLVALLAATFGLLMLVTGSSRAQEVPAGPPPPAAPTGTAPGTTAAGGTAVVGTLTTPSGPVAGARVEVSADGKVVGEATTAADGSFRVPVTSGGRYQVHLDTATLPEGVELSAQGRDTLDNVLVFVGRSQRVNFDLVDGGAGGTAEAPAAVGPSVVDRFADLLLSGARYGLVIALCAVGLTLIYATTGLVNFAHGELVTFGALAAWLLSSSAWLSLPLAVAAVGAFVLAAAFGALQDTVLWEPLRRYRPGNISALVVSIGLALFLRNIYLVVFDSNPRAFAQYATQDAITFGPVRTQPKDLVSMAVCLAGLGATAALLRWTKLGTAVRAVSDEPDLARSSGIDVRRVFLTVWALGAGLAGLGGVMLALTQGVQWNMGLRLLLVVFAAVVVGGFGSPAGAMLGGLLIGIVSEVSTYWVTPDVKDVFALCALILVLLIRPQGILGVRERVGMNLGSVLVEGTRAALGVPAAAYALAAIGLNVQFGFTGLLNFGQVGFLLVGAYGTAITASHGLPLPLAFLCGIGAAVILGLILGLPTLRLRADFLAIVTIAVAEILRHLARAQAFEGLTGGSTGIQAFATSFFTTANKIPKGRYGVGDLSFDERQLWITIVGWALVAACALLVRRLVRAPWGRVVKAVRADQDAPRSLGKNVFAYKIQALVLGGAIGALGGIVLAVDAQDTNPDYWVSDFTFYAFASLIIGGLATTVGPVIGAMVFWFLIQTVDSLLRQLVTSGPLGSLLGPTDIGPLRFALVGLALMLLMIFRPQGILGDADDVRAIDQ